MGFEEGTKRHVPLLASTYMVGILYVVGIWTTIRLHQSNQGHSMASLALIFCKYHVPYFFPCCNLQSMIMYV
jgi:hypothetical protein